MINGHFGISVTDIEKFHELKRSAVYSEYMQGIVNSPIMAEIINEHIEGLDVEDDIKKLKNMNASVTDFSNIFIDTIKKMANRIVADTIILKELSDISIQDVKDDLTQDFKIKYILGLADSTYYKQAEQVLKNKPDKNSVLYYGLLEFYKRDKKINTVKNNITKVVSLKKAKIVKKKESEILSNDFTSASLDI